MVQERASRFSFLAAGPLSADRASRPLPTSPHQNRVRGSRGCPSGRLSGRGRRTRGRTPGLRACGCETASGRKEGVQTDPNGLLYMRARYYNPYICRFLNPDPSGFNAGLNLYQFANGNPVSYWDSSGLCAGGTPANPQNPFNINYNSSSSGTLFGNGLNNTVSAIGQSMGQGLFDAYNGVMNVTALGKTPGYSWQASQNTYAQIWNQEDSVATPANPAATPYVEGALGVSGAAVVTAGSVGVLEATVLGNQSIMVEGVLGGGNSGSGGLLQLRVPGEPPIVRFDYHPIPGSGGSPVPHIDSPPLGWSHWPW